MPESEELFQVCNQVIDAKLTPTDGVERIKQLKANDISVSSRLLDILVVLESETDTDEKKEHFNELVKGVKDTIIPADVLTLELESNQDVHKKALIRHKTRLYFKQTKFNLLREESEGYAKLVTELLEVGLNETTPEAMKSRVLCLIGQFNLDPNRVLTVVLQCFECLPKQKEYFIALVKEMAPNNDHLHGLIGFQFSLYQVEGKKTPFSLYTLTACLIQAEILDLMKITACLQPNAEGIKNTHRLRSSNAAQRVKKAETIITTQIAENNRNNRDMDREGNENQSVVGVSFAAVSDTQDAEDERILGELSEESTLSVNQKLGLVCALLETGQWSLAQYLIDRLPEFYAVQSGPRICRAIIALIDDAIDDFYRDKCCSSLLFNKKEENKSKNGPLPKVESWADVVEKIAPILWYLGPRIGYNATTTTKFIRLLAVFFEERKNSPSTSDDKIANVMMDIVDECLLCSLSMQANSPNVAVSEEIWNLLQLLPYQQRYRLYGRWKFTHTSRHPELSVNRAKVLGRTKYVLKRLSKETVKIMGRQLGKLCHVHPMTVLDYMLSMVQTFDNFIGPVVESLKYLTLLEFDVLSFCLMEQLANPDRLQLKASDGNLSMWLQALGTMVGSIYKKYNVELAGILNYVANQLKNNKGFDLLILREIIQNMSSVESSINATEEQLEALRGGEVLRQEAGGFSTARNKRASYRLKDALMEDDIAFGLCVLIAQQREFIIHRESMHLPLKLVGEMLDQCRDTLVQFGTYLMQHFKYEDYCKRIPSAAVLMEECGLPLDVSMFLTRTFFTHLISEAYTESKKARRSLDTDTNKRMDNQQKFVFFKSAMDDVIQKFANELNTVNTLQNSKNVQVIGMKMLVTFWMLSSYDIEVPTGAYDRAIEAIRRQTKELDSNPELSKTKKSKDLERLATLEGKLKEEQRKQTDHVERVRMWLNAAQEELFLEKGSASIPFLATCVLKRAIFSETDAIFCAKLVLLLHSQKTTYFQTMIFFDKTFADLLPFITGLTENEATAFGRFLEILLSQANKWNLNKDLFDKECYQYPGFHLKIGTKSSQEAISISLYKSLTWKWQLRSCKSFVTALQNPKSDYVVIRNCFIILAKMITCFPIVSDHHSQMEKVALDLQKREKGKRDDLALLASSYAARLKSIQKTMVDRSIYSGKVEKPKPESKPPVTPNGTSATEKNDKRKTESTPSSEPRKRPRAERTKASETAGEKKSNGSGKENNQVTSPAKDDKEREGIEDGEVSPEHPSAKKPKQSQNGRDSKEKNVERTPRARKREENGEKKERRDEHREGKYEKRDDKKTEKKDDKAEERKHERLEHDRKKDEPKLERREVKGETHRVAATRAEKRAERAAELKDEKKDEPKKRREVIKEAEVAGPELPPKEDRKDKREDQRHERKEVEKTHKRESKKEEKKHEKMDRLEQKNEKKDERGKIDKKEELGRDEKKDDRHNSNKEEKKDARAKEEVKEEKKEERPREERKRITVDRSEEPGVKISRTLSSGKNVKLESKEASVRPEAAPVRKHRPISPPRETSFRRPSNKEPQRATFRR